MSRLLSVRAGKSSRDHWLLAGTSPEAVSQTTQLSQPLGEEGLPSVQYWWSWRFWWTVMDSSLFNPSVTQPAFGSFSVFLVLMCVTCGSFRVSHL